MIDLNNLSGALFILTMRKLSIYDKISKEFAAKGLHKEGELLTAISNIHYSYFLSREEEETDKISNQTSMKKILDGKGTLNLIRKKVFE